MTANFEFISYEKKGTITKIGLNRPDARNAMNTQMLQEFARALTDFEDDPESRCALIFAHGKAFTLGLALDDVSKQMKSNKGLLPEGTLDPWEAGNGAPCQRQQQHRHRQDGYGKGGCFHYSLWYLKVLFNHRRRT